MQVGASKKMNFKYIEHIWEHIYTKQTLHNGIFDYLQDCILDVLSVILHTAQSSCIRGIFTVFCLF